MVRLAEILKRRGIYRGVPAHGPEGGATNARAKRETDDCNALDEDHEERIRGIAFPVVVVVVVELLNIALGRIVL